MRLLAKAAVLAAAAVMCLSLVSCEKKKEDSQSDSSSSAASSSSAVSSESSASPSKVMIKNYTYPSFLHTLEDPDLLSREVYQSFDKKMVETAVQQQLFPDYNCISLIASKVYTYSDSAGKYVGLLSLDGKVILKADKYNRITAVSNDMIMCSFSANNKENTDLYRIYENGTVTRVDEKDLSPDHITINEFSDVNQATGEAYKKQMIRTYTGSNIEYPVGNNLWDTAEKCDPQKISTGKTYRSYYKVSRNGASYYVCFDEYHNYVIYEAAYARICLKIGNVSGECYVQSFDDYTELSRMVKSFGKTTAATTPDSNETLDYIQITFGLNSPDQQEMTISSDGWCLIDNVTHNNQPDNKYFACYDKDSFASLVLWVDEVLSKEYAFTL